MSFTLNRRTYGYTGYTDDTVGSQIARKAQPLLVAVTADDESVVQDAVNPALTFPMDTDRHIDEVFAEVVIAPDGAELIVDIKVEGVSMFSTLIQIDDGELDTNTASVPAVISNPTINQHDKVEVFVTQRGTDTAGAGLKLIFK